MLSIRGFKNFALLLTGFGFASGSAFAQTNVLVNGSFETGLSGWTQGTHLETNAAGTCGYNAATAPGVETITSAPGFAAIDGTEIVLGSVTSTSGLTNRISCVLYQDVAIPAGATTATFTLNLGLKNIGAAGSETVKVGLFSTASVPALLGPTLAGPGPFYSTASATLAPQTSGSFDVSALAGTTVRFAIINGAYLAGTEVAGLDNVQLLVNVAAPPPASVPTLSEWSLGGLAILLASAGYLALRRRPA